MKEIYRAQFKRLLESLHGKRQFIQVLSGPRQVGKTTLVQQIKATQEFEVIYGLADEPDLKNRAWLDQEWNRARRRTLENQALNGKPVLLVVDEIQKIEQWSEAVKRLWDEDTFSSCPLRVVLLGSSRLIIHQGLSESLAGRFEVIPVTHWTFSEMKEAFSWTWEQYVYFGGYPGAAELIVHPDRWKKYILESLIETTLSRDLLLMTRVDKPALLRRLFQLGCHSSGQVLSFQKMLGQLVDAGNVTTLSHYLDLLSGGGMLAGLQKFSNNPLQKRASSPRFQVYNNAFQSVMGDFEFHEYQSHPNTWSAHWGRSVESAVGADLLNRQESEDFQLFYWREGAAEVDYVVQKRNRLLAIEVKSGQALDSGKGLSQFKKQFPQAKLLTLGGPAGVPIEEFLLSPVRNHF